MRMFRCLILATLLSPPANLLDGHSACAQTFSLDLATAAANGVVEDDLLLPGPALLLPGAAGLPPVPPPPPPADIDGLSFGQVFLSGHTLTGAEFSVTPGSIGAAGTAVIGESGGVGFVDEPADIFVSALGGSNGLVWDGDGVPGPAPPLGVLEPGSNTDAWDFTPPFGMPPIGPGIHYSLPAAVAAGHPIYFGSGATGSWIFFSPPVVGYSVMPAVYATDVMLGLLPLDDIDGLSIIEDGLGGFTPGDTVYFSLTAASPTLGVLGASAADILSTTVAAGPAIATAATTIGLVGASDDVDALEVLVVPKPCDFNFDSACNLADMNLMLGVGNLVVGVPTTFGTAKFDLILDNVIDNADITDWLSKAATENGHASPYLRGDTDGLGNIFPTTRTVDITDFTNFLIGFTGAGVTWDVGNFDGDNDVDITDFSLHFLSGFVATSGGTYGPGQAVPEPSTVLLLGFGSVLLGYLCCGGPSGWRFKTS